MDDVIDPDVFEFGLPTWIVVDATFAPGKNIADCVPKVETPTQPAFVPLFTDEDLGERFIAGAPLPGCQLAVISDATTLVVALELLRRRGAVDVGIDVSANPRERGRFKPIGEFLQTIYGRKI